MAFFAGAGPDMLARSLSAPALRRLMRLMQRRHPELFDRLAAEPPSRILVQPSGFPAEFLLRYGGGPAAISLTPAAPAAAGRIKADAAIAGALPVLIDLLEGRLDGDALFFSRQLRIEGDMARVVALRNAVDGGQVHLCADIAAAFGPAAPIMRPVLSRAQGLLRAYFDRRSGERAGEGEAGHADARA